MEIIDIVRRAFGAPAVIQLLGKRQNIAQPLRTLVFGNEGKQYPLPAIPLAELKKVITNVPVIRRGTQAYALNASGSAINSIEAQPIEVSDFMTAAEILNMKQLGNAGVQNYADLKMSWMMDICQRTTEALCAESLSGKIAYPMKTDGGALDVYEVDFGTPASIDAAGVADLATFYELMVAHQQALQDNGYGSNPVTLVGKNVFSRLITQAQGLNSNILNVDISKPGQINIGGYSARLESGTYRGVDASGQPVIKNKIDPDGIKTIDLAAGHTLFYLALDDIQNGFQPLPFATTTETTNNPSGLEIVGRSKPLPAPVVGAIVDSVLEDKTPSADSTFSPANARKAEKGSPAEMALQKQNERLEVMLMEQGRNHGQQLEKLQGQLDEVKNNARVEETPAPGVDDKLTDGLNDDKKADGTKTDDKPKGPQSEKK